MVWMQEKLRQALGLVKDQTKIGLTRVSMRNRMRELDIVIVKATSHSEEILPADDDKYANEILQILCNSLDSIREAAMALTRRFEKTRNWVVALKCVRLLHRLLRVCNGRFEQDILVARCVGLLKFTFSNSTHDSCKYDVFVAFVRAYSQFMEESMEGKASMLQGLESDDNALLNLVERTPKSQRLLDCAIACLPLGRAKGNHLVLMSLEPVLRESFKLYADICHCITTLLDNLFDMERSLCVSAFEIYRKAAFQSDQLAEYYEACKGLGACEFSEYPTVEKISQSRIDTLEEFITQMPQFIHSSASSYESPATPTPAISLPLSLHINQAQGGQRDLIVFEQTAYDAAEEENKLALALFSESLETKITNEWEPFDSPKDREEDKPDWSWEVALDMSAASASINGDPFAASAGINPPSYVQMEDTRRSYLLLLQQQQFWRNYQNKGMPAGCSGYLQGQYSNPFSLPFRMPASHALCLYNRGGIA